MFLRPSVLHIPEQEKVIFLNLILLQSFHLINVIFCEFVHGVVKILWQDQMI